MSRLILTPIALIFQFQLLIGAEPDLSECCTQAAKLMKQQESVIAFKLHGFVKETLGDEQEEFEVWLECRVDKVWCQKLRVSTNSTDPAKSIEAEIRRAKLVDADRKTTTIFDGKKEIRHRPIQMAVTIDAKDSFSERAVKYLFPTSWTNFSHRPFNPGKYTYRYVLGNTLDHRNVQWLEAKNRIRVSLDFDSDQTKPAYKTKWLELDPSSCLVVASDQSGGYALPHAAEYQWAESPTGWYVASGSARMGDQIKVEWKIDSYSCDAKQVRPDFELDETNLPLGTRIEEDVQAEQSQRKTRYVGDDRGKRVHDLLQQALKLAGTKDTQDD